MRAAVVVLLFSASLVQGVVFEGVHSAIEEGLEGTVLGKVHDRIHGVIDDKVDRVQKFLAIGNREDTLNVGLDAKFNKDDLNIHGGIDARSQQGADDGKISKIRDQILGRDQWKGDRADADIEHKQKVILDILRKVYDKKDDSQYRKDANRLTLTDNLNNFHNPQVVKDLANLLMNINIQDEDIFSVMNDNHRKVAVALIKVLVNAKDWDTLYKTIVWGKYNLNTRLFVYSLNVALKQRKDMQGLTFPPMSEVLPSYFFTSDIIDQVQNDKISNFDSEKRTSSDGRQEIVLERGYTSGLTKEQKIKLDKKIKDNLKDVKTDKDLMKIEGLFNNPINGRSSNKEQKVAYFTEDVGLNNYYYNLHTRKPFWLDEDKDQDITRDQQKDDRRGEKYLFELQQLVNRYDMERQSNNLDRTNPLDMDDEVEMGYDPQLRFCNGVNFPSRDNRAKVTTRKNVFLVRDIKDLERRVRDAIIKGSITLEDNTRIDLTKRESLEQLGRIIEGNKKVRDNRVVRSVEVLAKLLLGGNSGLRNYNKYVPSAIELYETSLRDPLTFKLFKRILRNMRGYHDQLDSYTRQQLAFDGVKIQNADVDKLTTFFTKYETDISGVVIGKEGKDSKRDTVYKVRQDRLNHQNFNVKINVKSDKNQNAVVRVFLGPKYDDLGNTLPINKMRRQLILLDTVKVELKAGQNTIERNSIQFKGFARDCTTILDMYKKALTGDDAKKNCNLGFPQRLLLPKGKISGMPVQVIIVISSLDDQSTLRGDNRDQINAGDINVMGVGKNAADRRALNFPFDRIVDMGEFFTPNMYFVDTNIFHKKDASQDDDNSKKNW